MRHAAGKSVDLKKELGVLVLVLVTNDPVEPTMLIAPEGHWGSVNAADAGALDVGEGPASLPEK